jgi:hypothetical protein
LRYRSVLRIGFTSNGSFSGGPKSYSTIVLPTTPSASHKSTLFHSLGSHSRRTSHGAKHSLLYHPAPPFHHNTGGWGSLDCVYADYIHNVVQP